MDEAHDVGQWLSLAGGFAALWRLWGYVVGSIELRARLDERVTEMDRRISRIENKPPA